MNNEKTMIGNSADSDDLVLDVRDLVVHYALENETVEAVNNISFSLKKGGR